ncbi:MAG: peptidoglycan-binding protein [Rhodoglobus sp.]|nr:peptidoglycan-binding protein [Rhodoglobus sp.]
MVTTFWVGVAFRGSDEQAFQNSQKDVFATASVEFRAESPVTASGMAQGGATLDVSAVQPKEASIAQVSIDPQAVGTVVAPGSVLTAISGRPIFALPISGPYFRDLSLYDSGPDVLALNAALATLGLPADPSDNEFGWSTAEAVAGLYEAHGFEAKRATPTPDTSSPGTTVVSQLPKGSLLPFSEVAALITSDMVVASAVPRLQVVQNGDIVIKLSSPVTSAIARVNALDVRQITVGQDVTVRLPGTGKTIAGSVLKISDFRDTPTDVPPAATDATARLSASPSGYDVVVSLGDAAQPMQDGEAVTLEFNPTDEKFLAVPATSIQQDGTQSYVLRISGAASTRVSVKVRRMSDGWALLDGSTKLAVGETVRVG